MNQNILKIHSVAKHHDLVQMHYFNSTLNEEKIFNFLIYVIKNKQFTNNKFTTSHREINQFLGFKINNKSLKSSFIKMMGIVLELALLNKKKSSYKLSHFIKDIEYIDGEISIELSKDFISMVLNDKENYCKLNFALINSFKSKYTIRLYENIIRYTTNSNDFIHLPKMEIKTFKKLMGIEDKKYKRIAHLQGTVIDVAVHEINSKTDVEVSYELFKSGNTYTEILFLSRFKKNTINLIDNVFFYGNEKLLDFIDIFLPKYADKKVIGFIDNKKVYFYKTNNEGGKKLILQDKIGKTTLEPHISMEVLNACYYNRETFEWFEKPLYEEFLHFQKEKNSSEGFYK